MEAETKTISESEKGETLSLFSVCLFVFKSVLDIAQFLPFTVKPELSEEN